MVETPFFDRPGGLTVGEIAKLTGAELAAGADPNYRITDIAPIDTAGPGDIAFLDNPRFIAALSSTRAGACLLSARFEASAPKGVNVLRAQRPHEAFVRVARAMYPASLKPGATFGSGIAATASVHPTANVASGVTIEPGAVIGPEAVIGEGSLIGPNAVVGPRVRIGQGCSIGAGATLMHTLVGDRVIIHPGCHIGQDGFGYVGTQAEHLKVPQVGRVIIENDVEIGAGTTVDRGMMRDTTIGAGTKIDNLVHIGHNCTIGKRCIIVAGCVLAGSVTLGDFVQMGMQAMVIEHRTIGRGAKLAVASTAFHDVPAGEEWGGVPAKPRMQWMRELKTLERLAQVRPGRGSADGE